MMLQQDTPADYVVATGVAHSVRECLEMALDQAGIDVDSHLAMDPALRRPAEVDNLIGDASRPRELSWEPRQDFEELIRLMVDFDTRC